MSLKKEQHTLSNYEIDAISEAAITELRHYRIADENLIKTRFSLEEALLRMQEHFGEDTVVEVSAGDRFGRHVVEVKLAGEAYNPLKFSESEYEEWNQLLSYADYQPDYHYHNGINIIRWSIHLSKYHPAVYYTASILIGIMLGFAGRLVASEEGLVVSLLGTVEEVWIRLLNVLSGPVVFLLIITTVLNMDTISRQGGNSGSYFRRVFRVGFRSSLISIVAGIWFFVGILPVDPHRAVRDIENLILQLTPQDVLTPFAESNSPQLLLLAFVIGSAIIATGMRYESIADIIHQSNSVCLTITSWMGEATPYFLIALLSYEIIGRDTTIYIGIWKPLLVFLLSIVLIVGYYTLYVASKEKVRPMNLVNKLKGPFLRTIIECSADAVYDESLRICHSKLGVDAHYAESSMSIGCILFTPVSALGVLIFTFYAAGLNDVKATTTWYVFAVVSAVTMSIASPPVTGVSILTYVVLFAQLGIPGNALIAALLFDILISVILSAVNQYMMQLEIVLQADKMAMLNHSVLRREE